MFVALLLPFTWSSRVERGCRSAPHRAECERCATLGGPPPPFKTCANEILNASISVHYGVPDRVSNAIRQQGSWDLVLSNLIHRDLEKFPGAHFLDVGSNVGWFSLLAASVGARVTAVEANADNVRLLRHTMCMNPQLSERITLHAVGVGDKESGSGCALVKPALNVGDTHVECGPSAANATGGGLRLTTLNKLMRRAPPVSVMKIDIEGFEPLAARGWNQIFDGARRPRIVLSEFRPESSAKVGQRPEEYLEFFTSRGYTILVQPTKKRALPVKISDAAGVKRWLETRHVGRVHDLVIILPLEAAQRAVSATHPPPAPPPERRKKWTARRLRLGGF